jgi:hypothetical protein
MAVAVQRSVVNTGVRPVARPAAGPTLTLPETPDEPIHDINAYSFLFHGEKKIGKTTLLMEEPGVFLLTFDPKQKSLGIMQRYCPNWATFEGYLKLLESRRANYPYTRVVIDGIDIWYRACQNGVCKELGIKHPSEEGWGKAWDMLKERFANAVDRLLALPGGCWFISHSDWREIKTRSGEKVTKLVPLVKAGGEEILVGRVDGWFAYVYDGPERVLIIRGDESTGAGHRIRGHFETPDGRQVVEVPMGNSETEAWANLQRAFRNEQPFITVAETRKPAPPKGGVPVPQRLVLPVRQPVVRVPVVSRTPVVKKMVS